MMTWMKLKFTASVGLEAPIAGGVATVARSQTEDNFIFLLFSFKNRFGSVTHGSI